MNFKAKINSIFSLKERGTVLCIEIVSGKVKKGDFISMINNNGVQCEREINAVEFVVILTENHIESQIGLVIKNLDPADIKLGSLIIGCNS
jgi:translation elongation factor EF-Tu-like GTPase